MAARKFTDERNGRTVAPVDAVAEYDLLKAQLGRIAAKVAGAVDDHDKRCSGTPNGHEAGVKELYRVIGTLENLFEHLKYGEPL